MIDKIKKQLNHIVGKGVFVPYRPFDYYLKDHIDTPVLTGVEIGVAKGNHTVNLLRLLNIDMLFLIDPYESYQAVNAYFDNNKQKDNYSSARDNLKKYDDLVCFKKMDSKDAINEIPDNLDFVYVDGDHRFESVKGDIENYYPKLRYGGVIGGHDWQIPDVAKAVLDCFPLDVVNVKVPDWWVVKKKTMNHKLI